MFVAAALFSLGSVGFGITAVTLFANGHGKDAIVFVILCPMFLLGAASFLFVARMFAPAPEYLRSQGIPAHAKLVGTGGGMTIQSRGSSMIRIALHLEISALGHEYRVTHKTIPPIGGMAKLIPGTTFSVFIDPKNRNRLLIDWDSASRPG